MQYIERIIRRSAFKVKRDFGIIKWKFAKRMANLADFLKISEEIHEKLDQNWIVGY
jgi:hypothetical protein